jgi:single-strand DNA-binding protein
MYLNKVFLYGNLTRDPEVKALPSGQSVASFGLATNRTFTNKEGAKQEQTEFHNIVAFGRTAEVMGQYLKKGRPVFVEGRLQTRSWESEGRKNYRTEIVVDNFQFGPSAGAPGGGARDDSAGYAESAPQQAAGDAIQYPDEEINPEDIPF